MRVPGRLGRAVRAALPLALLVPILVAAASCDGRRTTTLSPTAGPSSPNPGEPPPPVLRGTVRRLGDEPGRLEGALVVLTDVATGRPIATTTTDEDGRFRFENLTEGRYAVTISGPGFFGHDGSPFDLTPLVRHVEIRREGNRYVYAPEQDLRFSVVVSALATVEGVVRNRSRAPIGGAAVRATVRATGFRAERDLGTATTGADGRFTLEGLPEALLEQNAVRIAATAPGYYEAEAVFLTRRESGAGDGTPLRVEVVLGGETQAAGGFDRLFWDQIAFDYPGAHCALDPGDPWCRPPLPQRRLRTLSTPSPDVYIRTAGDDGAATFPAGFVAEMERRLPDLLAAITGSPHSGEITTGPAPVQVAEGTLVIEAVRGDGSWCSRSSTENGGGRVRFNHQPEDGGVGDCYDEGTLRHGLGHAMGFFDVEAPDSAMFYAQTGNDFSSADRLHMQLAYRYRSDSGYREGPQLPAPAAGGVSDLDDPAPTSFTCPRRTLRPRR